MNATRQELFGTDLLLREGAGGLDLAPAGRGAIAGDLALATGNANIVQALSLRLRVRKGEMASLGWPDFGSRLHELIGEPDIPRIRLKAQAFARQAVEADPRVVKVLSISVVSVKGERGTLRLEMSVRLIDSPTPLDLVFGLSLEGS